VYTKEWRFRRLLSAGYWSLRVILVWLVDEIVKDIPIPNDATVYLMVTEVKKKSAVKKIHLCKRKNTSRWRMVFWYSILCTDDVVE